MRGQHRSTTLELSSLRNSNLGFLSDTTLTQGLRGIRRYTESRDLLIVTRGTAKRDVLCWNFDPRVADSMSLPCSGSMLIGIHRNSMLISKARWANRPSKLPISLSYLKRQAHAKPMIIWTRSTSSKPHAWITASPTLGRSDEQTRQWHRRTFIYGMYLGIRSF